MTSPDRFIVRMAIVILGLIGLSAFLYEPLRDAFAANIFLNGLILGVLLLGVLYNFRQVILLYPEVNWIERFRLNTETSPAAREPRLLSPMVTMLRSQKNKISLSTHSMRSLLDGMASRLDESRELSRYTIGLLIFLGLLGTFWGLLETVNSIGNVIGSLSVTGGDFSDVFAKLKDGLIKPLDGMGTAFSSSLFGLAGSLILGFLDLQAGQAQNRFYNDLEEWLSGLTRLSPGSVTADGEGSSLNFVEALLEQTAEGLESMQRIMTKSEQTSIASGENLIKLSETLNALEAKLDLNDKSISILSENQLALQNILEKLSEKLAAETPEKPHQQLPDIKNIEVLTEQILKEITTNRVELLNELRSEIKLLARTIASSSKSPE